MLEFIKYLSGKFLIFGSIAALGGFLIIYGLGSYDISRQEKSLTASPGLPAGRGPLPLEKGEQDSPFLKGGGWRPGDLSVSKESAKAAAEALLGKNNLPESFFKNTTEALAKNISEKIVENNPAGPGPKGAQKLSVPNPENIVNDYIQKGIEGFDYAALKPKIADSEIKISDDVSATAIADYLKGFFGVLNKVSEAPSGTPESAVATLIKIYGEYLAGLYALPVPKIFTELHKKQLAILTAEKNIYELVQNYEEDPLKAILAMRALEATKSEMANLYTEIVKLAAEKGGRM